MLPPEFVEACDKAIGLIGVRLARWQLLYGAQCMPNDGGVAFRDEVYKHPYFYSHALLYWLEQDADKWTVRNREAVLGFVPEQLVRVAGASDFYVRGRDAHFANADRRGEGLQTTLRWLAGLYSLPAAVAARWFEIVTKVRDHDAYFDAAPRHFYADIAGALGRGGYDGENAAAWGGVAFSAGILGFELDEGEWAAMCWEHFAHYQERATLP